MNCVYLRNKFGNICALPNLPGLLEVNCEGNQLYCAEPLKLAIIESDPKVNEEEEEEVPEHLIGLNCTLGEAGAYEVFYKGESK